MERGVTIFFCFRSKISFLTNTFSLS